MIIKIENKKINYDNEVIIEGFIKEDINIQIPRVEDIEIDEEDLLLLMPEIGDEEWECKTRDKDFYIELDNDESLI